MAIKSIQAAGVDAELMREVDMLRQLQHERLVAFVGATHSPGMFYIVLEFMPGGSLHTLIHSPGAAAAREAMTLGRKIRLCFQMTEGVVYLHSRRPLFVHRDLKAMNIVLDLAQNAKLCDFGLTQSMERTHMTRHEQEGGSPRYMAPELYIPSGTLTEKIDIWALGCLFGEVAAMKAPHHECTAVMQVMTKAATTEFFPFAEEDLRELARERPQVFAVVRRCLVKKSNLRLSAPEIVAALRTEPMG